MAGARLTVIAAHRSKYPNPIAFSAGESVTTGRRDDEFPGWIWVCLSDGNEGWAPEKLLQRCGGAAATTLGEYSARELDVDAGEGVTALEIIGGWVRCRTSSGAEGWIPEKNLVAADDG